MGGRLMGKRSDFPRVPKDSYDTPASAVAQLLAVLEPKRRFIEPCVGRGALVGHLKAGGHELFAAHDLPDDARVANYFAPLGAIFITNPPYWGQSRDLHPLIANLSDQAPTWLLMSADWLFNKSSAPLMSRLRRIVAVGRVKWIPDSPFTGMDNCMWALFGAPDVNVKAQFTGRLADLAPSPPGRRFSSFSRRAPVRFARASARFSRKES
jgi:hypothetical protein